MPKRRAGSNPAIGTICCLYFFMNSNITKTETHDLAYLGKDLSVTPVISLNLSQCVSGGKIGKLICLSVYDEKYNHKGTGRTRSTDRYRS